MSTKDEILKIMIDYACKKDTILLCVKNIYSMKNISELRKGFNIKYHPLYEFANENNFSLDLCIDVYNENIEKFKEIYGI